MAVLILVKGGPTLLKEPYASCVIALPRGNSDDIAESAERAIVLLPDLGFGPFTTHTAVLLLFLLHLFPVCY